MIRAELEALYPVLVARAAVLSRGLRPPKPGPEDLVNTVVRRLLRRYRDSDIKKSVRQLAFTALARLVIDISRRPREALLEDDQADKVADHRGATPDLMVRRLLGGLPEPHRCVVWRIAIEGTAVPAAFAACGWATPSPYAEYNKILRSLRARLEETQ